MGKYDDIREELRVVWNKLFSDKVFFMKVEQAWKEHGIGWIAEVSGMYFNSETYTDMTEYRDFPDLDMGAQVDFARMAEEAGWLESRQEEQV